MKIERRNRKNYQKLRYYMIYLKFEVIQFGKKKKTFALTVVET